MRWVDEDDPVDDGPVVIVHASICDLGRQLPDTRAREAPDSKHLPGQHNQLDHGRRHVPRPHLPATSPLPAATVVNDWDSTTPQFQADVTAAVNEVRTEPVMSRLINTYGDIPIHAADSHDVDPDNRQAAAYYDRTRKDITFVQSPTAYSDPLADTKPLPDADVTAAGWKGVYRHEYAHHVTLSLIQKADHSLPLAHFLDKVSEDWGIYSNAIGDKLAKMGATEDDKGTLTLPSHDLGSVGYISMYSSTNFPEGVAEAMAVVTHPDFKPADIDAYHDPATRRLLHDALNIAEGKVPS